MRKPIMIYMSLLFFVCACSSDVKVVGRLDSEPEIFPDYKGVTIPCNMAPMNFEVVDGSDSDWVLRIEAGDSQHHMRADGKLFRFGRRFWRRLLDENAGETMVLTLCVKGDSGWLEAESFDIHVAEEEIDPYLVYRKIPPGYSLWKEMSICQRSLEDFTEREIYRNAQGKGNCVNCHSFRDRDPDHMMFHMRSELAGTYIFNDGKMEKLETKTDSTISSLVYPYWHTSGDYIAFSVNKTNQVLHMRNRNRIEVFDEASDVVVYDIDDHKIVTTGLLSSDNAFETFPAFSPDGRSLYYCSAEAVEPMPEGFRDVRYSLCRIDFDPEECTFGTDVDTLYNAGTEGRSVSFPRISPDGRFLVFVLSDYGNFSIWHNDADLYLADLASGGIRSMDGLNSDDVESYHSWSGNSRWMVFSSRRDDGLYTKPYICYIDEDGNAAKPFLLPQKDPVNCYDFLMFSYNIPEFVSDEVTLDGYEAASSARRDPSSDVKYEYTF